MSSGIAFSFAWGETCAGKDVTIIDFLVTLFCDCIPGFSGNRKAGRLNSDLDGIHGRWGSNMCIIVEWMVAARGTSWRQ